MSGYVNKVILLGNVGKDPVVNNTRAGKKMARFSMATTKRWKFEGEWSETTTWHNIVVFNEDVAKEVERTVRKGTRVYVEGELNTRKWDDNGVEKLITEIVINFGHRAEAVEHMGSKLEGGGNRAPPPDDLSSYGNTRPARPAGQPRNDDEEVPF